MRRLMVGILLIIALVLPVSAANVFNSTIVVPMSTRAAGTYTFSSVEIPTGVVGLSFTIDVTEATDPLPALSASVECSRDNGANWELPLGFGRGSAPKGFAPGPIPVTSVGSSFRGTQCWNDVNNVNRRLRGSATIGGTMRFALTVQPL